MSHGGRQRGELHIFPITVLGSWGWVGAGGPWLSIPGEECGGARAYGAGYGTALAGPVRSAARCRRTFQGGWRGASAAGQGKGPFMEAFLH